MKKGRSTRRRKIAYMWFKKRLPNPTPMRRPRLSETEEIQLAFQQEMARIFQEASPDLPYSIPTAAVGVIDGAGFLADIEDETLRDVGLKQEHIRVLKALASALKMCSRLDATPENLAICKHLFHPLHPITVEVADAFEEVLAVFENSIIPKETAKQ